MCTKIESDDIFTKEINGYEVCFNKKNANEWCIFIDYKNNIYEYNTNFSPYLKTADYKKVYALINRFDCFIELIKGIFYLTIDYDICDTKIIYPLKTEKFIEKEEILALKYNVLELKEEIEQLKPKKEYPDENEILIFYKDGKIQSNVADKSAHREFEKWMFTQLKPYFKYETSSSSVSLDKGNCRINLGKLPNGIDVYTFTELITLDNIWRCCNCRDLERAIYECIGYSNYKYKITYNSICTRINDNEIKNAIKHYNTDYVLMKIHYAPLEVIRYSIDYNPEEIIKIYEHQFLDPQENIILQNSKHMTGIEILKPIDEKAIFH